MNNDEQLNLLQGIQVASPATRLMAKFTDLLFVLAIGIVGGPIGALVGFVYSLVADGMGFEFLDGQSLGKKIFKLRVIAPQTGRPIRWRRSVFRNTPVGVATFFAMIPVWGHIFLIFIGFFLMIFEVYMMLKNARHRRFGDLLGDTEVINVAQGVTLPHEVEELIRKFFARLRS